MATVMPEGEALRKAIKWISAQMEEHPGKTRKEFINEAVARFDLSPKDADFLIEFYRKADQGAVLK